MDLLRALKNKINGSILGSYSKFAISILFEASTSKGQFADQYNNLIKIKIVL
jgi:hypothetical protein